MNQRIYLEKPTMPIITLLLLPLLLLFPLPSIAEMAMPYDASTSPETITEASSTEDAHVSEEIEARSSPTEPPSVMPQIQSESEFSTTVSIRFPSLTTLYGHEQSGLKAGDQFSVNANNEGDLGTTNVTADLHELGLPADVAMTKESLSDYFTAPLTLPTGVADGVKTFTVHGKGDLGNSWAVKGTVVIDHTPPTGTLKATFTKSNDLSSTWTAHVSGTFNGTGSDGKIVYEYIYGVDKDGKHLDGGYTSAADSIQQSSSPFSLDLPIIDPYITWSAMGYGVTIADQAGNLTNVESKPVPFVRATVPLIDHALYGSVVSPTTYTNTPTGVGIPYSLISGLPRGDYFAVVFFDGIHGCPSDNYQIGAFIPNHIWNVGVRPEMYAKAYATSAGGCMQEFNINPTQGDEWLWGALSNTGSAAAVADDKGIPAFAICETAAVCDSIVPHMLVIPPQPVGISNVLFLPGIEGSTLYRHTDHCNEASGECDTALWLPPNSAFVPQLFLGQDGKSLYNDVYTKDGDILTQAYGKKFYTSFFQSLNAIEASERFGTGWKWKAVAYDWRLSLSDIVHNGTERDGRIYYEEASSTPYIEQTLRELAATSKTGKVTIIAHSNGGLVAKALMQKLGYEETDTLIDKVILVGTPQRGVPEAIGALLYGDKQGIPGIKYVPNVIMSTAHARALGLNSPMAYSLLPTDTYFSDVPDPNHPVVSFTANTLWSKERAAYGSAITTTDELQGFALAEEGGRTMPAPNNLTVANILNGTLFQNAVLEHIPIDVWVPSEHVKVYQIAGWGNDTMSGIDLYERPKTLLGIPTGGYTAAHRPSFIEDGDGAVPVPSALMLFTSPSIKRYWENLQEVNAGPHSYAHTDLFEIPQLQTFLQNLVAGSEDLPPTIYAKQPATTNTSKKLLFILHSLEDFDLSDANDKHTGNHAGDIDESIPGSTYGELGDTQYVIAPSGHPYTLAIQGTSSAPFTLDIEEMTGDSVTASTTIADVPATDRTRVSLSITNGISDASPLVVDTDGDGAIDFSVSPTTGQVQYASSTNSHVDTGESDATDGATPIHKYPTNDAAQKTVPVSEGHVSIATTTYKQSNSRHTSTKRTVTKQSLYSTSPAIKKNSSPEEASVPPQALVEHEQSNQVAAVSESAFLRLLLSIATLLSRILAYIEGIVKAL